MRRKVTGYCNACQKPIWPDRPDRCVDCGAGQYHAACLKWFHDCPKKRKARVS